jgi:hypothetical protein
VTFASRDEVRGSSYVEPNMETLPIIDRSNRDDIELIDYLFDVHGYLVLKDGVDPGDINELNTWADAHQNHMDGPRRQGTDTEGAWIGHVETHTYSGADGINFQNIIEAGGVFERLIDYPSWIDHIHRFVHVERNGLSIHECLLNLRGRGGFIGIHSGGHLPISYMTFRQPNTGDWMVGQINVITALQDIGPGDGPTTLVPGSHKAARPHPRLAEVAAATYRSNEAAGTAVGMRELYLDAGDVLLFTDAITHGSAARTNDGYRRMVLYRYSPRWIRSRFHYVPSEQMLARLTPEQRQIIQPIPPRKPPAG